jgi:radical SAM protein with 4Fe4S-binding SPASM domain
MSPTEYAIPRSRAFDTVREAAKPVLRRLGPWYTYLADKWYWTKIFANYVAIKLGFKTGIWSQTIYVEVTNVCNAKCVFCAYPDMERPKEVMSLEVFKKAISQWAELGGNEVDLTPIVGDPFVDRFIFDRMDFMMTLPGIRRFHFFTNAILMKPELHERLLGYGEKLSIYCSFGGFTPETYAQVMGVPKFAEASRNIEAMVEAKRRTGSRMGLQLNLRTPPGSESGPLWERFQAAKRDGLLVIDRVHHFDHWAGMVKNSAMQAAGLPIKPMPKKRGPCNRLLNSPVIMADGRVDGCAARDIEASMIVGDLKTQTLGEIFSGPELKKLIDRHDAGDLPDVCKRCNYYDSIYPTWLQGRLYPVVRWLLG